MELIDFHASDWGDWPASERVGVRHEGTRRATNANVCFLQWESVGKLLKGGSPSIHLLVDYCLVVSVQSFGNSKVPTAPESGPDPNKEAVQLGPFFGSRSRRRAAVSTMKRAL